MKGPVIAKIWRWRLVPLMSTLGAVMLLVPVPGWGACSEEAQHYYQQGNRVDEEYAAKQQPCGQACLEQMRALFEQAVTLCPSYAEAHNDLGAAHERLGRYPDAITHYHRAIELNPTLAVAYFGLGDVYYKTGQYASAVGAYDQGSARDPEDRLGRRLQRECANARKDQAELDDNAIEACLNPPEIVARGPAGIREGPRIAIEIPFAYDSDQLLSQAQAPLRALGQALSRILGTSPEAAFLIEGHTDLQGTEEYNRDLSRRRAKQVAEALVQNFHLPSDRLMIQGYGKTRPVSLGATESDHTRNRRVEVVRFLDRDRLAALVGQGEVEPIPGLPVPAPPLSPLVVETAVVYEDPEFRPRKLETGAVLRSGDGYRLYFEPQQSCYVYIVQIDASGKLFRLYPNPEYGTHNNHAPAHTAHWIPARDRWFELDGTHGEEVIYFIAAREPLKDIDAMFASKTGDPGANKQELIIDLRGPARVRPGKNVQISSKTGQAMAVTVDQFTGEGVGFAHRFSFHHE